MFWTVFWASLLAGIVAVFAQLGLSSFFAVVSASINKLSRAQ